MAMFLGFRLDAVLRGDQAVLRGWIHFGSSVNGSMFTVLS